jgi:hypothetical protein
LKLQGEHHSNVGLRERQQKQTQINGMKRFEEDQAKLP